MWLSPKSPACVHKCNGEMDERQSRGDDPQTPQLLEGQGTPFAPIRPTVTVRSTLEKQKVPAPGFPWVPFPQKRQPLAQCELWFATWTSQCHGAPVTWLHSCPSVRTGIPSVPYSTPNLPWTCAHTHEALSLGCLQWFFSLRHISWSLRAVCYLDRPPHAEAAPSCFDFMHWVNRRKAYKFQPEKKKKGWPIKMLTTWLKWFHYEKTIL